MAAWVPIDAPVKQKPALALSKPNAARNLRPIQHESAAKRFVRRKCDRKASRLESLRFRPQPAKSTVRFPFVIHDDFVNTGMILEKLPARRLAEHGQCFDRESPFQFIDQRQGQDSVAKEARL